MSTPYVHWVSDLLARPGSHRRVVFEAPLPLVLPQARISDAVHVDVTLESAADRVVVTGTARAPVEFVCNRCLSDWTQERSAGLRVLFGRAASDEGYPLSDDDRIDLEAAVRDEMALSLPLVSLCRPDCAGLCPTCGTDLNTSECPGHEAVEDSPFAALQQLLDPD